MSPTNIQRDGDQILLGILDRLNTKLDDAVNRQQEQHLEVMSAVTEVRTQMYTLIGKEQPGRVQILEDKVSKLTAFKNRFLGYTAAAASIASGLWLLITHYGSYLLTPKGNH
jgi:hypothetical protein